MNCDEAVDRILELDAQRRALIVETETKKAEQNRISKEIPRLKKAGQDVTPIFREMAELKTAIAAAAEKLDAVEVEYHNLMLSLPKPAGTQIWSPVAKSTTSPCGIMVSPITLILPPNTTWTCAWIWASLTMIGGRSWPAPGSGFTREWAPGWSGPCSTIS